MSASARVPVRDPSPGMLVMIVASKCLVKTLDRGDGQLLGVGAGGVERSPSYKTSAAATTHSPPTSTLDSGSRRPSPNWLSPSDHDTCRT